jgi:multiple sugar transport system ATP-binding protein
MNENEKPVAEKAEKRPNFIVRYFDKKKKDRDDKASAKKKLAEQKKIDDSTPKICPPDVYVSMQKINKIYDNGFHAVHDFSIDIKQHEFIVFVGPSGCGKSTTLRMIAGLEDISGGNLFIDGDYMNDIAPKDRNIAMVFQSYALYPHMTVYENMAFPLKIMHLPKEEIDKRVMDAAHILQIEDLLDRKPKALSGGQRQRVALGRAIVHHAKVLLMDEPLSNLDAKLRVQMRSEIVKLHNNLGATTIYVTHDQTEAMTMATRIVIMKDGYIQQIGAPIDIFNHPVNKFVAGFIGSPAMNFFPATYQDGKVTFVTGQKLTIPADLIKDKTIPEKVIFGIRPEDIHEGDGYHASLYPDAIFDAKVILAELLGNEYYVHTNFAFQDVIARFPSEHKLSPKDDIKFAMNLERCHLFDPQSEIAIF